MVNASAVSAMPLHDVGTAGAVPYNVGGQAPPKTEDPMADVRMVAPGYFETMKIQLLDDRFRQRTRHIPRAQPWRCWDLQRDSERREIFLGLKRRGA